MEEETLSRDFKGVWIPREIWLHPELTHTEKLLFAEINSLDGEEGCHASKKYLASFLGASEWTVKQSISKLIKLGLIEQTRFDGRHRTLRVSASWKINQQRVEKSTAYKNKEESSSPNGEQSDRDGRPKKASPEETPSSKEHASRKSSIVELWNELGGVRHHSNSSSKTYREAASRIRTLRQGKLHQWTFDTKWLARYNIPKHFLTRQWEDAAIIDTINKMALIFKDGYWPRDKSHLPRALSSLIYNPNTKTSWFLRIAANGAPELYHSRDATRTTQEGWFGELAKKLASAVNEARGTKYLGSDEMPKLIDTVKAINELRKAMDMPAQMVEIINSYSVWIVERFDGNKNLKASWLSIGSSEWKRFAEAYL